jgi:hypothetical protein
VAICRAAAKTRTRAWRPCWTGYGTCRNFMRHYAWKDKSTADVSVGFWLAVCYSLHVQPFGAEHGQPMYTMLPPWWPAGWSACWI